MSLSKRAFVALGISLFCAALPSCSGGKPQALSFPIGQKVQVGKLFYQVVDAQWSAELVGAKQPPKNRILQLRLMVTNSGASEISVPMLRLLNSAGTEIGELTEIEGNPHWLGMIRRLEPALTEEGHVYFDVPVGAYRLEVIDNSVADNERIAFIEIPASLAPPPAAPGSGGM
ncbi:MAG TPA: DUF4352 domain-containing protein [Bryobacteraceae bacterium]|nr:DUF4352 domain-containing protein [Bryobacteraceae bacterium]